MNMLYATGVLDKVLEFVRDNQVYGIEKMCDGNREIVKTRNCCTHLSSREGSSVNVINGREKSPWHKHY
jgi:hypothetical protein